MPHPPIFPADSSESETAPDPAKETTAAALALPEQREAALYETLRALGIRWRTYVHAPVFTVNEARALRGKLSGGHSKNLFLEDRSGKLFLVVVREELRLDLNALAKALTRPRFSFGKPELLAATLGITPGAVTPFALMNDREGVVTAILDEGLLACDPVNFHPLRNDRTTAIAPASLIAFARACGHEPLILKLPERV